MSFRFLNLSREPTLFALAFLLAVVSFSGAASAQRVVEGVFAHTIEPMAPVAPAVDLRVERLSTNVTITVDGDRRVARVEVEERFRNNWHRMMEGDYLYPIPAGAVFTDFSLFMGEQELKGEMLSASVARGIYEEIVRRKKDPALIELLGHGVVRARVFPINPGETRRVILRYTQVLGRDGSLLRLRYPRVVGIFDSGEEETVVRPGQGNPNFEAMAHLTVPPQSQRPQQPSFAMTIRVTDADLFATPYSPTHRIEVRDGRGDEIEISYVGSGEAPRDFELFLPLREEVVGASVLTHAPGGEAGYYMLLVSPPAAAEEVEIPRDVTMVLDVSGSMSGDKMEQARAAMDQMLGGLREQDRFRIITYSSVVRQFRTGWTVAESDSVREARDWLATVRADGSTNIQAALQEALSPQAEEGRLAQVIFLTDGKPTVGETSSERIVDMASSLLDNERVFAFGVGHDVNTYLLDSLTGDARGTVSYVRPGEDVEEAVSSLTRKISFPALADLRIVDAPVMLEDFYPQALPDLFFGEDLVLFGRYRGSGAGDLVLEGTRAGETQRFSFRVDFAERDDDNIFISKLWASRKAGFLTTQVRLHGANPELVEEIRQLGLRYGILTEYTSYLVEEPNMSLDDATFQQVMDRARAMEVGADAQVGAVAFNRARRDEAQKRAVSLEEAEQALRLISQREPVADPAPGTRAPAAPGLAGEVGRYNYEVGGEGKEVSAGPRHVVDRLFVMRDGVWTDLRFADQRVVRVAPYSAAYFELVRLAPELKAFFALGESVIIAGDGLAIELAADGLESWSQRQLDAVLHAFGK